MATISCIYLRLYFSIFALAYKYSVWNCLVTQIIKDRQRPCKIYSGFVISVKSVEVYVVYNQNCFRCHWWVLCEKKCNRKYTTHTHTYAHYQVEKQKAMILRCLFRHLYWFLMALWLERYVTLWLLLILHNISISFSLRSLNGLCYFRRSFFITITVCASLVFSFIYGKIFL